MNRLAQAVLLAVIVMLSLFTVAGNHGVLRLLEVDGEMRLLADQNSKIESEIVDLNNKMYAIRNSDFALEKDSREQLGLSKPGEIVYIFSQPERR